MAADVITRFKLETTQFDSKLRDTAKALHDIAKTAQNGGKDFNNFSKKAIETARALGTVQSGATNTKDKLRDLVGSYNDAVKAYDKLSDAAKKGEFGQAMSASLTKLQQEIKQTKQELYGLNDTAKKVGDNGALKQLLGGVAGKFGMSASMFTGVGAAVAGVGAAYKAISDNISTAMGFEKSMSQLSSLTGMVGKDLEQLKEYAIELGSTSTLTASQVADAFRLIGSQQPQLLASGDALKEVTKYAITLSEAAGIDLVTAAQTLSTSINQMGGDSENAARYVNVLAAASQKGAGDIAWLGEAITKSATTAKAVGTDYEELVANLEQLAKAGFDASTAGTALRSIIMNLEKQTNSDFKPSIVGLTQAFENLGKANLDVVGYQQIAGKMFASQAMALANATEEAKSMTVAITGTSTATEQATTNTANLDGSLKALASAWEGLNLHINSSNGLIKESVDLLKDAVTWVDKAITGMDKYAKRKSELNNEGSGSTRIDRQISALSNTADNRKAAVYSQQIEKYWRYINEKEAELQKTQNTKDIFAWETIAKDNKVSQLKQDIGAAKEMLKEYEQRGKAIVKAVTSSTSANGKNETVTIDVEADTEESTKSIKQLQDEIKKLKGLRDDAANSGDTKLRDQYNAQIKDVQTQIKAIRGGGSTSTKKVTVDAVEGSIDAQTKKVQELQKAWRAAADDDSRQKIKEQIEQAQTVLDVISGKTDVKDVEIRVNSEDALKAVERIEGVKVDPKSFTVTVDDDKAADELKKLGAVQIGDKTFSITANDTDVLKNIKAIEGVTIADKSFTVTADDDKAADEVKKLGAVQISDKTFSISANDTDVLKNIKAIEGVTIADKSFTVTADDDKAADEVKKLGAVRISDKTFSISANDTDVLKNIKAIEGVRIDPKSFKVTALTADALAALQKVNDVVIADKTFKIEPVVGQMPSVAMENPFERAQSGLQEIRQKVRLEIDKENLKADTDTLQTILKDAMQKGINTGGILDFQFTALSDEIAKGINVADDVWQGILDQYNELCEQIGSEPIKIDFKTGGIAKEGKEVSKEWNSAANAISSVGSAMQSIEDPSAKIVGTIAQAIATIALTYAQSLKGSFTVWDWIAGAASGMATMMSVVSAIHNTTGYAQGGIVKGNSYSGDNIPAMVGGPSGELVGLNAGEVVLNKAQQSNLASQLEGSGGGGRYIPSHVSGEQIWIALNAYTKRSGKGELVTWR